jgi:hypothetical protein
MALCTDSTTLTFNGDRADDGGSPEEVVLTISKYCIDPSPSYENYLSTYDTRVDTTFDFSPPTDGLYSVTYTGGVSGIIEYDDVMISFNANNEVGRQAKEDVNKMLCNTCLGDEYMYKKALIEMAGYITSCERFCEAASLLEEVVVEDCESKIRDCGCS